jgi:cell division protein FtsW (lipid II flippase)
LYLTLAFSFLHSLQNNKDQEIKLLWIWIIWVIMIQAFVNIWVNLRILPNTWLTLPFVSFWWTALMVNLIELVLLIKISEFSEKTWMTKSFKK